MRAIILTVLMLFYGAFAQTQSKDIGRPVKLPFNGKYRVEKFLRLKVMSAIDWNEAKHFVGHDVDYRNDHIFFHTNISQIDSVKIDSVEMEDFTDEAFQIYTRGSGSAPVSFADLEYKGKRKVLTEYVLDVANNYGDFFGMFVEYFDPQHIIINYKGVYFKMKKVR